MSGISQCLQLLGVLSGLSGAILISLPLWGHHKFWAAANGAFMANGDDGISGEKLASKYTLNLLRVGAALLIGSSAFHLAGLIA